MKNINFDNPYLLLLFIPIILAIVIPYCISISKDNKTKGWKISLAIHLAIGGLISLALAGLMSISVLTKTTVYVLADVSYSSERNLDEIDAYIAEIKANLPENSKLGVVCFGKNSVVLTPEGRALKSVALAKVDDSATDIASALNYTGTLFKGETLKRIVLITDGNHTVSKETGAVASAVEMLTEAGIKVDTVFLDNTLKAGESEVQISKAEYVESVYLGHENTVKFLVQSSADTNMILKLYSRPYSSGANTEEFEEVGSVTLTAEAGMNTVSFPISSETSGIFEYRAMIEAEHDTSLNNNVMSFVQTVEGKLQVLLVTGEAADKTAIETMYGEKADVDAYVVSGRNNNVPFTLEELTFYDEVIVSNLDIREINNVNAFVDSLDIVVSQYGKSLLALGDLRLQNDKDDLTFKKFAELLPVTYGNANKDGRLFTIVLDVSGSMGLWTKAEHSRQAVINLLSVLEDEDYVSIVTFSGEILATNAEQLKYCKEDLLDYVQRLTLSHSTDVGGGLNKALSIYEAEGRSGQVILISDGISIGNKYDAMTESNRLVEKGIVLSVVNMVGGNEGSKGLLQSIARVGGGGYYEITASDNVGSIIADKVADDVADAIVHQESTVNISGYQDAVVDGFASFPKVSSFIQSSERYDASVPLTITRPNAVKGYVPLYAYRQHGNGRVSSFTSSISDDWTALWSDNVKSAFMENVLISNTPAAKVDYPFNLKVEHDEYETYVEITPSVLDPEAKTKVEITYANGQKSTKELAFDSQKYFYTFETAAAGGYKLKITYSYGDKSFTTESYFNVSYLPEYNAFASFDSSKIYKFMRGNGSINLGEIPDLENDPGEISTYKVSYTIPLLIAAAVLFLIDIIIRKFKIGERRKEKTSKEPKEKKAEGGETA